MLLHVVSGFSALGAGIVAAPNKVFDRSHRWHVVTGRIFLYSMAGESVFWVAMDTNPYSPPTSATALALPTWTQSPNRWFRRSLIIHLVVMVGALTLETFEHQTIVVSGLVFSLCGFVIAVAAFRLGDWVGTVFGGSAVALSLWIVFLINFNGWGPAQGDRPITLMIWLYALIAIPVGCRLVVRYRGWSLEVQR